ncbi:MAG: hypothetical protein R6X16_11385 [Anaerolineae bacterium]
MKAFVSRTMALALVCLLLALPASALATPPEPLTIEADLWLTGENSAAGTFGASGLFDDGGDASEVFFIADGTIHGVKTLVGAEGTITMKFQAQLTWTGPTTGVAEGRFVIVSGTGAYEKLHGVGESYAELDLAAYHIWAEYTGRAHID